MSAGEGESVGRLRQAYASQVITLQPPLPLPLPQTSVAAHSHCPSLSHRSKVNMEPESDVIKTFKDDVMQLLSTLLLKIDDTIDDRTATTIARFALLAVDMDAEKLGILVFMFYNLTTLNGQYVAKLLVKLLQLTPHNIQGNTTKCSGEVVVTQGLDLTRHFVLRECQYDFEAIVTNAIWSPRSIVVADNLFQAGHVTRNIMGKYILGRMATSDYLFVRPNFELFINTAFSCGPKLDALGGKVDQLAEAINKAFARVPAESPMFKVAMMGLVAGRDNNWIIETNTAPRVSPKTKLVTPETESPQVSTPATDSLTELEITAQRDLLLQSRAREF